MSFFYQLGRRSAPYLSRAKWLYTSLTGTEEEQIAAEHELGMFMANDYLKSERAETRPETIQLVREIGKQLYGPVKNKTRTFTFQPVLSTEENAFAIPGGFIFISTGLLDFCDRDRDQVAFIIAHEMGHVIKKHALNRFLKSKASKVLKTATAIKRGAMAKAVSGIAGELFEKGYDREQEAEADRFAVQLARAAGFDSEAGAALFEKLRADRGDDTSLLGVYFGSHPPLRDRIRFIRGLNTAE